MSLGDFTFYEWDVELIKDGEDEHYEDEEVLDHFHQESYKACLTWTSIVDAPAGSKYRIVLVLDDQDGRAWAYVEDGKLPEYFTDANGDDVRKVPKRFHLECNSYNFS